jgi:hypothetical protein
MDIVKRASETILQRLSWATSHKDQPGIAKDLAQGKDISEVYGLGEAGLFDEFFYFLEQFHVLDLFFKLDPNASKRQSNVHFPAVILIYLMRVVAGLAFFWHTHPVILQSQPLMRLIGFNGREVRDGTSKRGTKNREDRQEPTPIRGPICPDSIAAYIQAISAHALEKLLNSVVAILAKHSFYPKQIHALLDASEIESTQRCQGCGKVTKEKPPQLRLRKGRIRKVMETVFGFKLWLLWDPTSRLPLAVRFDTIEVSDVTYTQEIITQAVSNLGSHAQIVSVALDRGFLDGQALWWLHDQMHIKFYIPAKINLAVYKDALSLLGTGIVHTRQRQRTVGAGKNKRSVTDSWEVEGLEGLTSAGFYGEKGSGSHENRKDFVPNPINAVVVLDDPYRQNNPQSDLLVILTNAPVDKPLKVYDGYDARSEIENGQFREAKQAWFIERPARNTADGFRSHVYFTLVTMALVAAFRTWMDQQDKLAEEGKETGIRKFREQVKQQNGNKLIVFDEDRYAIFDTYEVFILCGTTVLKPTGVRQTISKQDILLKYGVSLE